MPWTQDIDAQRLILDGLSYLGVFATALMVVLFVLLYRSIRNDHRRFIGVAGPQLIWPLFVVFLVALYSLCFLMLPSAFSPYPDWIAVSRDYPDTLPRLASWWYINGLLLMGYLTLNLVFHAPQRRDLVALTVLSIISGLASTAIIMVIHQATINPQQMAVWIPYFLLAVSLASGGVRIVQSRLVTVTSQIVYEKRIALIEKVLRSDYHRFENMEAGNLEACLNNDTETISDFANSFVSILTSSVTTLGCFLYLAMINLHALLLVLAVILLALLPVAVIVLKVTSYWQANRTMQGHFFKYIGDLINGFKELKLKKARRVDFQSDMVSITRRYVDTQIQGNKAVVDIRVLVELIFYATIGTVLFTFPILFDTFRAEDIAAFLLIFIFMMAQVTILATTVPELLKIKVSWDRIQTCLEELDSLRQPEGPVVSSKPASHDLLCIKNLCYRYEQAGNEFRLGPLSCAFEAGTITFITGGNGSGKSTLAKLITGLYQPDSGQILLNGKQVDRSTLGECYSTVFSDYYLFDKLYGIDLPINPVVEEKYLETMKLTGQVDIKNGGFNTTQLSTGQRKRLALLVTYLEDSPILLFDEWAADQDPQFRRFFYSELLPGLRAKGKCVIAITHDDHYFDTADVMISLENGTIKQIRGYEKAVINSEDDTCVK